MRLPLLLSASLLAWLVLPAGQAYADCDDFTDVGDFICPDVRWLKNRQITLGCTATLYCPDQAVSRLQMAAFMNRLGNVVTPRELFAEGAGGTLDLASTHYLCQTEALPAITFRRSLIGTGSLSFDVTGQTDVAVGIVFSNNGGATWNAIGSGHLDFGTVARGTTGQRQHAQASQWTEYAGSPSSTFAPRYALAVAGVAGPSISSWTCQLQLTVQNNAE